MGVRLASRKAFYVLTAIVVALAASLLLGGEQAYAADKPVARINSKSYTNLQDAFNEVQKNQRIVLLRDVVTDKEFKIVDRGIGTIGLELNGHTITRSGNDYRGGPVLHIANSYVRLSDSGGSGKAGGLIGKNFTSCIRLDSGLLRIELNSDNKTKFSGYRVADVYGGRLLIYGGTYENPIVVRNPEVYIGIKSPLAES